MDKYPYVVVSHAFTLSPVERQTTLGPSLVPSEIELYLGLRRETLSYKRLLTLTHNSDNQWSQGADGKTSRPGALVIRETITARGIDPHHLGDNPMEGVACLEYVHYLSARFVYSSVPGIRSPVFKGTRDKCPCG